MTPEERELERRERGPDLRRFRMYASQEGRAGFAVQFARTLEEKAGILLSHISIMIAVTGVIFSTAQEKSALSIVSGVELVLYLLLALAGFVAQILRDSPCRLRGVGRGHEQACPSELSHDELARLQRGPQAARLTADLV